MIPWGELTWNWTECLERVGFLALRSKYGRVGENRASLRWAWRKNAGGDAELSRTRAILRAQRCEIENQAGKDCRRDHERAAIHRHRELARDIDLEQPGPELPRHEQPIPDGIECDPVRDAAALGHVLAFRRGQQIPHIDPTHDVAGSGVDAGDEICLVHVRPQLAAHPLQLVEHPDGAICLSHLNRALLVESHWVHHPDSTGAIAHVESASVGGESPSFAGVSKAVDWGERSGVVDVSETAMPRELVQTLAHDCNSFSELCWGQCCSAV